VIRLIADLIARYERGEVSKASAMVTLALLVRSCEDQEIRREAFRVGCRLYGRPDHQEVLKDPLEC
jgi:hypothetical protein